MPKKSIPWLIPAGAAIVVGGLLWSMGFGCALKLLSLLDRAPDIEWKVRRWSAWHFGVIEAKDFELSDAARRHALVRGDFKVRFNPAEVWFAQKQNIRITGNRIVSDWLENILGARSERQLPEYNIDTEIILAANQKVTLRQARIYGEGVEATFTGVISFQGELDLTSRLEINRDVLAGFPGVISAASFLSEESNSAIPATIEINCALQGSIDRPHISLTSDLFRLELG